MNNPCVLYIKLGDGGKFEEECIQNNYVKLSYHEIDHELCHNKEWDKVKECLIRDNKGDSKKAGAAERHLNQIKFFYTAPKDTYWITFHKGKLWWCQAHEEVTNDPDNMKYRNTIGHWSDIDGFGKPLTFDVLSGNLTKTMAYRGTICEFEKKVEKYVLERIKGVKSEIVEDAEAAFFAMQDAIIPIIKELHWAEFELLIDLIFRRAGWQRLSSVGETQKFFDLDLTMPITNQRALVQIKTKTSRKEIEYYIEAFNGYNADFFFIFYHTLDSSLIEEYSSNTVKLCSLKEISKYCIELGLVNWLMQKSL